MREVCYIDDKINSNKDNRFIVIHGENDKFHDGDFQVVFNPYISSNISYDNSIYFSQYLKENYLDDLSIRSIITGGKYLNFDILPVILYMNQIYNDIVFEDVTNDNNLEANNHIGIFFIPRVISEKQHETVKKLSSYFSKYKQISMCYLDIDENLHIKKTPLNFINGSDIADTVAEILVGPEEYVKNNRL